jgi:hypothetical protein
LELLIYRSAFHPAPKGGGLSCFKIYCKRHPQARISKEYVETKKLGNTPELGTENNG